VGRAAGGRFNADKETDWRVFASAADTGAESYLSTATVDGQS